MGFHFDVHRGGGGGGRPGECSCDSLTVSGPKNKRQQSRRGFVGEKMVSAGERERWQREMRDENTKMQSMYMSGGRELKVHGMPGT